MIIVTAGHVDHGKTALLQALTGTNADRLPEEKKRGMTIDLGYAYLPVGDRILGFIDVPGHEKFLSNMLAGLGGVDYAMLMVAADEGIKPQTVEHLTLLHLLQFKQIIIVITKADRADSTQIAQLLQQIRQQFPFLAQSPAFITSAYSDQGIDELKQYLLKLENLREQNKPFRYAIDRVFTLKGAGLVVTGTVFGGKVSVGDEIYLSSTQQTVRVKTIHAQNQDAPSGIAGQRVALNLATDLSKAEIERGDWLTGLATMPASDRITVKLNPNQTLNDSQAVHIYYAANHTIGKMNRLISGNNELVEVIMDKPLLMAVGDKLILRSADDQQTLAGATVLEINSPKRHKRTAERLSYLQALLQCANSVERIKCYLQNQALATAQLQWMEQLTTEQLQHLQQQQHLLLYRDWVFSLHYQQQQQQTLLQHLAQFHQQHQDQQGVSKARLWRMSALHQPMALIFHFIDQLTAQQQMLQANGWLHLPEHQINFTAEEQQLWQAVEAEFAKTAQPIWVRDMATALALDEQEMRRFMYKAGKMGLLIPIVKDRFFRQQQIQRFAQWLKVYLKHHQQISVNEFRDQLGFGRKLSVQLIEYFDRSGFLRRKGNYHLLRDEDAF
ncbi:selenocysteine-specific translation elongation factor [Gallibacterium anatis]|uniref:Selenocysteine-specific elongation factor n=1 Tax=Gallibacterium anatis TaxID=750 RepID=A0A1A7NWY4_9PAST|nr:selenocysteine-specific translation elongation factor [Gallibacterium anatis]OBW94095.1 translation elongation factor [Gallibacterium anatis]OBX00628.1 translation elongation factor [Gallibacterium anatis]